MGSTFKYILILYTSLHFVCACNQQQQPSTTIEKADAHLEEQGCEFGINFLNDYIAHIEKSDENTDEWIAKNPLLSENVKNEYKKLVDAANEADPELGLGFDPILDAQDFPSDGFTLATCDEKEGFVTAKGKDWPDFTLVVKVVQQNEKWLVDGVGVVNVPEEKRAAR